MKITIITVNLNNHEGLSKTIESVIGQTYKEFEFIIVDGASTDGSLEVIKTFNNSALKRFSWVSEPDSGIFEAMNKGIRNAGGEYLLFLNSGDFFVNEKVLESVFCMPQYADFLLGQCNISENGIVIHTTNPPDNLTFGYLYNTGLSHQSTFIKRELFLKYGNYREDFKYNSDIEFWYRAIILGGASLEKINVIVCDYNLNGITTKQNTSKDFLKEHEIILSHPILKRIVPDYNKWRELEQNHHFFLWVQNKKSLLIPLKLIYKVSNQLKKMWLKK